MSTSGNDNNALTETIRIEVSCWYMEEQSRPDVGQYAFSYTISIHNTGSEQVQLLTRQWLITDAEGNKQEVQGDGVVGEQPVISPGETHTYSSGAIIETPVGTMEGLYGMTTTDGQKFNATIPVFRLAVPGVLN